MKRKHLRIVSDEERRQEHNKKVLKNMNKTWKLEAKWFQQVAILVVSMLIVHFILSFF